MSTKEQTPRQMIAAIVKSAKSNRDKIQQVIELIGSKVNDSGVGCIPDFTYLVDKLDEVKGINTSKIVGYIVEASGRTLSYGKTGFKVNKKESKAAGGVALAFSGAWYEWNREPSTDKKKLNLEKALQKLLEKAKDEEHFELVDPETLEKIKQALGISLQSEELPELGEAA